MGFVSMQSLSARLLILTGALLPFCVFSIGQKTMAVQKKFN